MKKLREVCFSDGFWEVLMAKSIFLFSNILYNMYVHVGKILQGQNVWKEKLYTFRYNIYTQYLN